MVLNTYGPVVAMVGRAVAENPDTSSRAETLTMTSLINAKNPTPERQRAYQAAYKAHTRLWKIVRTTAEDIVEASTNIEIGTQVSLVHHALPNRPLGNRWR
jgi:hypothetical protein